MLREESRGNEKEDKKYLWHAFLQRKFIYG
jgi:hypothetical protein